MATILNKNNTLTFTYENSTKNKLFEDKKSDIYFKKPIVIPSQNYFICTNEKISNHYFIPTIVEELTQLQKETQKLENQISKIEITKKLKDLKANDLRSIIDRISEEDFNESFMDHRYLFTCENNSKSSSLQNKVNL